LLYLILHMFLIFHFFFLETKETKHLPAVRMASSASRQEEKFKEKQCFNAYGLRTPAVFPAQHTALPNHIHNGIIPNSQGF